MDNIEALILPPEEFKAYGKTPRLLREAVITEKIDGTNVHVLVPADPSAPLLAGSRNRWITPGKTTDNFGFAAWVLQNTEALRLLGPGRHYGEWWGCGIGRSYGLAERRWSLFDPKYAREGVLDGLPSNVRVVPLMSSGVFDTGVVDQHLCALRDRGSLAVPGWMKPEGLIVHHRASGQRFKVTLHGDGLEGKTPSPIENP